MVKVNIFGFDRDTYEYGKQYRTCVIHPGYRLVPKEDEPGVLWCVHCGTNYLEKDTASEEQINSMFGPSSNQSKIIQAKRKRKFYDKFGNLITDETLIQDILQEKNMKN